MFYTELPAAPELAPWIAAHWCFRVAPEAGEIPHTIPLTGGGIFGLGKQGGHLIGPRLSPLKTLVLGGDVVWGSHFWPGATGACFGKTGAELFEVIAPAVSLVDPAWLHRLGEGLAVAEDDVAGAAALDRAWLELTAAADPLDQAVMTAVFRILRSGGEGTIAALANSVQLSPRQLRRRFRVAVGLAPKELAQVQRFRVSARGRVVDKAGSWVDVAASHGYADQAHLVREYRRFLGLTPSDFERHLQRIEHGKLLR